jgi:hypothetical protein
MDSEESVSPPPLTNNPRGNMGGVNAGLSCRSSSHHSHTGSCHSSSSLPPGRLLLSQAAKVIHCISPAEGSATIGYIYLATHERSHEEAITAYFDSAGREVSIIPCPDFETFMVDNHLSNRDIVFDMDLPCHVIPASIHIVQANRHNDSPNLDWMPPPPNSLSNVSSWTTSLRCSLHLIQPLLSSKATLTHVASAHRWPDAEGVGFNPDLDHRVPSAVFMGGRIASQGSISSTTIHKLQHMGGTPSTQSPAHSVEFEQPVPLPSRDSIISVPQSTFPSSPHPLPPTTFIKDKPLDMGLKDITDKDSWIDAKAVIDSRLRRAPFWPSPTSKALVTMPDNVIASAWWEELLYFYLKPPVCDLFVEESQFDGKGFEMIE